MIARGLKIISRNAVSSISKPSNFKTISIRSFGQSAAPTPSQPAASKVPDDVVVAELVDTLEWLLDSPPNVHQFEEPPIVVEIEHLDNLIINDH